MGRTSAGAETTWAVAAAVGLLLASVLRAGAADAPPPGPGPEGPGTRPSNRPDIGLPGEPSDQPPSDGGRAFDPSQHATGDFFGLRPLLEDAGVVVSARLAADYSTVYSGGRSPGGTAFRDLHNVGVTVDAGKAFGLPGGTFFANFQNQAGDDGSRDVGDLQRFSNVDADGRTQLSEVWYEQALFHDMLKVRVGKIDPNATFAAPANGTEFINSSPGIDPTIFIPHYPDPAFGLQLLFTPDDHFYLGGGVFDGSGQEGVRTGAYGPKHLFGSPADLVILVEGGPRWGTGPGELAGRLTLGAWRHTGTFNRFGPGGGRIDGLTGCYFMLDQALLRVNPVDENDARGVAAFLQYGYADPRASLFTQYAGAGVAWTGPLPGRDADVVGVGAFYALFADGSHTGEGDELEVELFYKVQLTPFLSLKPDLQYVRHPGGGGPGLSDALVGTLRVQLDF